jgi:hypothetical protein
MDCDTKNSQGYPAIDSRSCKGPLLLFWLITFPLLFFFYLAEHKRLKFALLGLLFSIPYVIVYCLFVPVLIMWGPRWIFPPWYLKTFAFVIASWLLLSFLLLHIPKFCASRTQMWSSSIVTVIVITSLLFCIADSTHKCN